MKNIKIRAVIDAGGFTVFVNNKSYKAIYPQKIWQKLPSNFKESLSETAACFFTAHLQFMQKSHLEYLFPPPPAFSLYNIGLMYSLPEIVISKKSLKYNTAGILKDFYNNGFEVSFEGYPKLCKYKFNSCVEKTAAIPFSFGKDSLLTYALLRELGIRAKLYFFQEPASKFENVNKGKLIDKFKKEFKSDISKIDLDLGNLRQTTGPMWGWDMLLTQYTLMLIPYIYKDRIKYLFWSNEQSVNEKETDEEDYVINVTYEQGNNWLQNLNNLLRMYGLETIITSLIEPLQEIFIMYILHKRYPQIAKYQLSCFNDHRSSRRKRWCGNCFECARVYVFMLALGLDPKTVGFEDDMLGRNKRKLHFLFDEKDRNHKKDRTISVWGERRIAFYLAVKRGLKADLLSEFQKGQMDYTEKMVPDLLKKYLKVYPSKNIPTGIFSGLMKIYKKEQQNFRREINSIL